MARQINQIYDLIQYIVRKERGVYITIAQAMSNLDAAQLDCMNMWFDDYGQTQEIHDALKKFRVYYQFTTDAAGFVTYPSDIVHLLGQPFTVTGSTVNRIVFVNEDELPFALTSQLRAISTSYPIAVDTSVGFSIYPQTQQTGFFFYLKRPATPVYAYTQVGRTITYDAANSTQLEWSDIYINRIIAVSLKYAGINMDEQQIYQFAEIYQNETNSNTNPNE